MRVGVRHCEAEGRGNLVEIASSQTSRNDGVGRRSDGGDGFGVK